MAIPSFNLPELGELRETEDVEILDTLTKLATLVSGNIDAANIADGSLGAAEIADASLGNAKLAAAADIAWSKMHNGAMLLDQAGSNADGTIRRGKSIIAAEHSRTNVAYGKMGANPGVDADQVSGIVVPQDGLLVVRFQGMWKYSVSASAAIFVGANQLSKADEGAAAPSVQLAAGASSVDTYTPLVSYPGGLVSRGGAVAYTGDVATGQALGVLPAGGASPFIGGACLIEGLPAGTYDVSIQTKSASGSVSMKNRKLWVEAVGF